MDILTDELPLDCEIMEKSKNEPGVIMKFIQDYRMKMLIPELIVVLAVWYFLPNLGVTFYEGNVYESFGVWMYLDKGQEHEHQDHQHSQDDEPQLNFILRHLMILYIISVPNATNLGHYIWCVLMHNILDVVFDRCIKRYRSLFVVRWLDT